MKIINKFQYPKSIRAYNNGQRLYDINNEKLPSVTTILNATKSAEAKVYKTKTTNYEQSSRRW